MPSTKTCYLKNNIIENVENENKCQEKCNENTGKQQWKNQAQSYLIWSQHRLGNSLTENIRPTQVKSWLLISSIFYVMNFRHFSKMP